MKKQWISGLLAVLIAIGSVVLLVTTSRAAPGRDIPAQPQTDHSDMGTVESEANVLVLQQSSVITSFAYWPISDTHKGGIRTDNNTDLLKALTPAERANFLKQEISSDFGLRNVTGGTKYHPGIDISTNLTRGIPVVAVANGVVKIVKAGNVMGQWPKNGTKFQPSLAYITIYHPELGVCTKYQHILLAPVKVTAGNQVQAGNVIGYSGPFLACPPSCKNDPDQCTCASYKPHLHFSVIKDEPRRRCWIHHNDMENYYNPLKYYPLLNSDEPVFSPLSIRLYGQTAYSLYGGERVNQMLPLWVSVEVRSSDKDIDEVSMWATSVPYTQVQDIRSSGMPIHTFDYHAGNTKSNNTMYFDNVILDDGGKGAESFSSGFPTSTSWRSFRTSYVYPGITNPNVQSTDTFYVMVDSSWFRYQVYFTFLARDVVGNETHSPYLRTEGWSSP